MPTDQSRAGLEVSEGRGDSIKGLGVCKCHIINQAKGKVTTALPITQHGERIVSFFRLSRLLVWAALFFFFCVCDFGCWTKADAPDGRNSNLVAVAAGKTRGTLWPTRV